MGEELDNEIMKVYASHQKIVTIGIVVFKKKLKMSE